MAALIEIHPEVLLEAVGTQTLTPAQRAQLQAHCEDCPVCAMELQARLATEQIRKDEAQARSAAIQGALAAIAPSVKPPKRWKIAPWTAAAAVLLLSTVSYATMLQAELLPRWSTPRFLQRRAPETPAQPPKRHRVMQTHKAVRYRPRKVPPAAPPSAALQFKRAVLAQRQNKARDAARRFEALLRTHPNSPEARVAMVRAATLYRRHLKRPQRASRLYRRYIEKNPKGPLSEQAHFGLASALETQGRPTDAKAVWRALLEKYPRSIHIERARKALGK